MQPRARACDVAIVGAGPAGVGAALTAAAAGADVVIVDQNPRPGGQIWRRPNEELGDGPSTSGPLSELERSGVRVLGRAQVWGADGTTLLLATVPGGAEPPPELRARAVVVATGAYDRPVPFPGWTLAGVLTPGGAQATLKATGVAPGRRAVVAGAGPFLLVVARALADAGVEVAQVVDATAPHRWLTHSRRAARHPRKLAELAAHRAALRAAGAPVRLGRIVVRAEGDSHVERVEIARADRHWRPVPGEHEDVDADLLCVGFGFVPQLDVAAALGCATRWSTRLAARSVTVGAEQETSVAGVFVAGEATGVGGSDLALAEGRIAGAAAARHAGLAATPAAADLRARRRHAHLAGMQARLFAPAPGLWELADDDTVICRCEGVTLGAVRAAGGSPNALKTATRVGMGRCQGRICGPFVARAQGVPAQTFTARPPIRPIPLSTLAQAAR